MKPYFYGFYFSDYQISLTFPVFIPIFQSLAVSKYPGIFFSILGKTFPWWEQWNVKLLGNYWVRFPLYASSKNHDIRSGVSSDL